VEGDVTILQSATGDSPNPRSDDDDDDDDDDDNDDDFYPSDQGDNSADSYAY
jgi:hypothetical protein